MIRLDRGQRRHGAHERRGTDSARGIAAAIRILRAHAHHQADAFVREQIGAVTLQLGRAARGRVGRLLPRMATLKEATGRHAGVVRIADRLGRVASFDAEVRSAQLTPGEAGHRLPRRGGAARVLRGGRVALVKLAIELIVPCLAGEQPRQRAGEQHRPESARHTVSPHLHHGPSCSTIARMNEALGLAGARSRYLR